jgi:hypothetical protein
VEGGFVLQRDTEDLADDRHRNRIGIVVDDVESVAAVGFDLVQRVVAELLNVSCHVGDDVRGVRGREVPHHLSALLVVLSRIGHDQARLPAVRLHVLGADVGLRVRCGLGRDGTLRDIRADVRVVREL